ncbi:MAG: hypothetical protein V3U02_02085 [Calditrichia bacterium]
MSEMTERNKKITLAVLNGRTFIEIAIIYNLSGAAVRAIVHNYCNKTNREIYQAGKYIFYKKSIALSGKKRLNLTPSLTYLKQNKALFFPVKKKKGKTLSGYKTLFSS